MPQQEAKTEEKHVKRERDYDRTDFAYWDWDKQTFRAFRAENVVRICAVSIPNYRETENDDNQNIDDKFLVN